MRFPDWCGPVVLEHYRRPRNQGRLEAPDLAREGANPLCGDHVRLELRLVDGVVAEARFTASACAVTVAATSLLTERIVGQPVAVVAAMADAELLRALEAPLPVARVRCALLPLVILREMLAG